MTVDYRLSVITLAAATGVAMTTGTATAQSVADFYKGKKLSVIIGYGPGGGYDRYARMLASAMGKHIPGNPSLVPKNMPGAGSLKSANYIYGQAPKDGTEFAIFGPGVAFEPLRGGKGVQFDTLKFGWLGSLNEQVGIVVALKKSGLAKIEDAMSKQFIAGASGSGSSTNLNTHVLNSFIGTKFKVIVGYGGSNDITLAMERGEVDAITGWSWDSIKASKPDWVNNPDVNIVLQIADEPHPEIKQIPLLYKYVKSEQDKRTLQLIFAHQLLGRPFTLPPDVPKDRLMAMRKALADTAKDPDFLAQADKSKVEISYVSAERIEQHLKNIFSMPKDLVERAAKTVELATSMGDSAQSIEKKDGGK